MIDEQLLIEYLNDEIAFCQDGTTPWYKDLIYRIFRVRDPRDAVAGELAWVRHYVGLLADFEREHKKGAPDWYLLDLEAGQVST